MKRKLDKEREKDNLKIFVFFFIKTIQCITNKTSYILIVSLKGYLNIHFHMENVKGLTFLPNFCPTFVFFFLKKKKVKKKKKKRV
jgi:hypothetical protein